MTRRTVWRLLVAVLFLVCSQACATESRQVQAPAPTPASEGERVTAPTLAVEEAPAAEPTAEQAEAPTATLAPALTPTPLPSPTPVPGQAEVLSHSSYAQAGKWRELGTGTAYEGEFLTIIGEVRNSGPVNLDDIEIAPAYLDASGNAIDAEPIHTAHHPGLLRPGEKAPFMVILLDEEAGRAVAGYELTLGYRSTEDQPNELELLAERAFDSKDGFRHVIGEVRNAGSSNVESVKLLATFYDEAGTVIDMDFTFSGVNGLGALAPGQKSPFDLYSDRADVQDGIRGYSLHAEARTMERPVYRQFEIVNQASSVGILGDYIVEGTIKNTGDQDVTFVKVVGAFYGPDGRLAAAAFAYTDPIDLKSGETGEFSLSTYRYKAAYGIEADAIESYELAFECSIP